LNRLDVLESVLVAAISAVTCRYYLHMLQLESYQLDGYNRWLNKNRDKLLGWTLNIGVIATVAKLLLPLVLAILMNQSAAQGITAVAVLAGFGAAAWRLNETQYITPPKKPLAYTPRMKRLFAATCLVSLLAALLLTWLGVPPYLLFVGIPYLALVAGHVMHPIERQVNRFFFEDARAKLAERPDLIRIGITGSYGKTSTKFILAAILSERFSVLATPSSFNTPMGLTKVIRTKLEPHHQVFIAEMGARHRGDIRELCELVSPVYGVLTSVGAQHLETFGSIETIADTKFELIEGLTPGGASFFGADDGGHCDGLYARAQGEKYRAGIGSGYLSMYAEDITAGPTGSRFTLADGEGGRVRCETKLLGRHNIQNIVLSCAVAKRLGMTLEEIARGVGRAQPVEHRLQLIEGANGLTIIDDAFNANPAGAAAAFEVLRGFPGRHIVVTPGLVEQGEQEEALNFAFGQQMAAACDIAILVGPKRTRPIVNGLMATGFDAGNLYVVGSLEESKGVIAKVSRPGDVILFENDLPDNYAEG
jgi:UDP-N-acetylmuramoyl-tripeptide--D-alanyl-D-alanine ligase